MPNDRIPLTARGHDQARELAKRLEVTPSLVLVSAFRRTQETAEPFCRRVSAVPVVHQLLHEFSPIDPALITDKDLAQRALMTEAYWNEADPHLRLGEAAETFHEFATRVVSFEKLLDALPDATVIFGHGMWLSLLMWRLLGANPHAEDAMHSFRRFQTTVPMPNCAVFAIQRAPIGGWSVQAGLP